MSFYSHYRKFGEKVDENEYIRTVRFNYKDKNFVIYITKKSANRLTHIHCREDETVNWEQRRIYGFMNPSRVERVLAKPKRSANEIVVFVIKGRPGTITGLDEGIFVSAKKGRLDTDKDIFVMSEAVFKCFEPNL